MSKLTRIVALSMVGLLAGAAAAAAQSVAIKGADLALPDGRTVKGAVVLIQDGKIKAIGKEKPARGQKPIKIPYDAKVIDAKGKTLFPGMVLAHTSEGLDRANERVPVGPYLDVYDSIDPSRSFFESCLRDGYTSVHVIQGNDCLVAGVGRVLRPFGMSVDAMTSRASSALKISVYGKRGYDRVRQRAELREVFAGLGDYLEALAEKRYAENEKENEREVTVPPAKARELGAKLIRDQDLDDKHRNLYLLTRGRMDAFVYVERAQDASFAVQLAKENGFLKRTVFCVGSDAFKAVSVFKAAKRPVILTGSLEYSETDRLTGKETRTFVPKVFADARIPFALLPGRGNARWLWYQAARCVAEGVSRGDALRAITTVPAAICGVGKRAGSFRPGSDADLLILSGDPLDVTTRVEHVLVEGKVVYERAKDWRLRKLIGSEADAGGKKAEAPKKDAPKKADAPKKGGKKAPKKGAKKAPKKAGGK